MSISKFIARRFNRNSNPNVVPSQEGLPAAKPGATANARRRNRSINLNVESYEERVVPAGMASLLGGSLSFLGQQYAAKPFLDKIFGTSTGAGIKQIQDKLNVLQRQVTELQNSVNLGRLEDTIRSLEIPAIETYWGHMQDSLTKKLEGKPWSKTSLDGLAKGILDDLTDTVKKFDSAFAGRDVLNTPLMKLYSSIIKDNVSVSKTDTRISSPFLTTNYSTRMADAFNYFLDQKAKAMILVANAYEYTGQHERAKYTIEHFASPYATNSEAKARWASQITTLPKYQIPNFMIVDTGTKRAWSQFDLKVQMGDPYVGYFSKIYKEDIPNLWRVKNYLNNNFNSPPPSEVTGDLRNQLITAGREAAKSGLRFNWKVPSQLDLGQKWWFYTDRGFNFIYSQPVWIEYNGWIATYRPGSPDIEWLHPRAKSPLYTVFYQTINTGDFFV